MEKRGYKGKLTKKPKNPIILEGFPGFGLVATITTGFLIDHLKCEKIGSYWFEDSEPIAAIHKNELVDQIGVFYNKKNNIIILNSIANPVGKEWTAADLILNLAKELQAKEIISTEGVGGGGKTEGFYYADTEKNKKKLEQAGIQGLGEGIIVGVTGALLLKRKENKTPITCLFATTQTQMPDSKAAAKIIEILDKYLGLNVDYKPLLKQAEIFEAKLKDLLTKQEKIKAEQKEKEISYVG
ncbi:hypothetical protein DRJ22_04135 [Candidatus Woesearchaeota archaeon]|nr:MAG: hypothetical protein B6U93_00860 [Candidatus Woesearchaeota archaeon ex4484_78]RLE45554.1 MAG: hypothetical protein DRJ22_04135 [Candidatus Woesearchaeota archaeon]